MRRFALSLALAFALLPTSSALAADHLQTVSEVMLSTGGDTSAQFVELRATSDQPFPLTYRIASYDSAGGSVGSHTLSSMGIASASTDPYLISTAAADTALTTSGDETLPAGFLPAGGGQVCFEQGMAVRRIQCVAYGCIATGFEAQSGTSNTVAPPDGQSVQRQGSGSTYRVAAPTPKTANQSGGSAACTGGGGGGGGGGGSGDTTDPDLAVGRKKRQDVDRLAVTVTLDEDARVVVTGSVNVPGASAKVKVRKATRKVDANAKTKIRVKLKRKAKRRVKAALDDGAKSKASLRVVATDAAGNSSTARPKIRLKD